LVWVSDRAGRSVGVEKVLGDRLEVGRRLVIGVVVFEAEQMKGMLARWNVLV